MKSLSGTFSQVLDVNRIKPPWYLAIGIATMALTHMTFSTEVMTWVSSVPFLIYLSLTNGWKSRAIFFLALVLGLVARCIEDYHLPNSTSAGLPVLTSN